MRIYLLVLQDVFDTGLAALLDTFSIANALAKSTGISSVPFTVRTVAVRTRVTTGHGLVIPTQHATRLAPPDVVIVPAISAMSPQTLQIALERRDIADAQAILLRWSQKGTLIGAACTGTLVLAGTSLLKGRPATTTWWLSPFFRARYPDVVLDESRMIVSSPGIVTGGAALAHFDLALWLVRRTSPALASLTARYLVVEPRPSQAAFIIPDQLAHTDPLVERFEQWARSRLDKGFSLREAAHETGTSARTLARRLHSVVGRSPLGYFQDLRIERAVHLLQTSDSSLEQIAAEVGYENGVSLRALIRRKIGCGVREIRTRHCQ